jgi:hypothetical protein
MLAGPVVEPYAEFGGGSQFRPILGQFDGQVPPLTPHGSMPRLNRCNSCNGKVIMRLAGMHAEGDTAIT